VAGERKDGIFASPGDESGVGSIVARAAVFVTRGACRVCKNPTSGYDSVSSHEIPPCALK